VVLDTQHMWALELALPTTMPSLWRRVLPLHCKGCRGVGVIAALRSSLTTYSIPSASRQHEMGFPSGP
jgi:hypothetical protein